MQEIDQQTQEMTGFILGPLSALRTIMVAPKSPWFSKIPLLVTWKRNVKKQPGNWSSMTRYFIDIQYKVSFFVPEKFVKSNIRRIGREKKSWEWVEQTLISEKNLSDDTNLCVTIPCHSFLLTIPYINFFIKKVECKETILVSIYFISHQSLCIKLFNASKTSWMLKRIQEW